uniref:ESPR domain-containing protein n=1 Tax=Polynucleobacter asymbioticus TaxID=576611 RepID=UPI000A8C1BF4
MNRVYRIVWSKRLGALVVVSEITHGQGKSSSKSTQVGSVLVGSLLMAGGIGAALPQVVDPSAGPITADGVFNSSSHLISTSSSPAALYVPSLNIAGSVTNMGTIAGEGGSPANGIKVNSNATLSGNINNAGTIISGVTAIAVGPNGKITGSISNTGLIVGSSASGIAVQRGTVLGGITNSGLIAGTSGDGGISVNNYGYIGSINNQSLSGSQVGTIAGRLYGIVIQTGGTIGSINNAGSILGGTAIKVDASSTAGSTIAGSIINSGLIAGSNTGISVVSGSSLLGGINNSETILGNNSYGINVSTNSLLAGGIYNSKSGFIYGGLTGINVGGASTVAGGFANDGSIIGYYVGVRLTGATVLGGITNTGMISGYYTALELGTDGTNNLVDSITNTGSLIGENSQGLQLQSIKVTGDIINAPSGFIYGGTTGVQIQKGSTLVGSLINDGTIVGSNTGIRLSTNSTILGTINNTGTIAGNTYSLNLQNTASGLVVNNSGTLIGAANIGINTLNLSGSNAVVAGSITGSSSSTVNVLGTFSSGGDIAVGAVNISNTGALTLNNNVNVNTGTGTLTNAGNLIVA